MLRALRIWEEGKLMCGCRQQLIAKARVEGDMQVFLLLSLPQDELRARPFTIPKIKRSKYKIR